MSLIPKIVAWWNRIPEEKRSKIIYECGSIFNTFIAAFLIQIAIDIEAAKFVIPLDFVAWASLAAAALRSGIKAILQLIVGWIRSRYGK